MISKLHATLARSIRKMLDRRNFLSWSSFAKIRIVMSHRNMVSLIPKRCEIMNIDMIIYLQARRGVRRLKTHLAHRKIGFVTATKLGTTDKIFVAATKNFAAVTKRFVDRTKNFVVVTKYFYPYFNK